MMKEELYKRILKELSEINFSGEIRPYTMGEPLIDQRIVKFIKMTRNACPNAKIILETNGSLLTEKLLKDIVNVGAKLTVNDYSKNHVIIEKIKNMKSKESKKITLCYRSDREILSNRAGSVYGPCQSPLKLFCRRPFESIYIGFNGKVILCCQDWKFEEIMGDVSKNSLIEIWCNKKYNYLRNKLLKLDRIDVLCELCDYGGF